MRVDPTVVAFLAGCSATLAAVAGLFFLRSFQRSRDRFFALFATAFFILSAHWVALSLIGPTQETRPLFFAARAVAFLVILAAIVDKNRQPRRNSPDLGQSPVDPPDRQA